MAFFEAEHLSISFVQYGKGLRWRQNKVIYDLKAMVDKGEILAVVGSSGSGKSLLAHAILGILPGNARVTGSLKYDGEELTRDRQTRLRGREIALVPQSVNYLDPLMRVGAQVRSGVRGGDPYPVQRSVFKKFHLKPFVDRMFPFQLSGGMARRILFSTAVVTSARLIVADEPTPGMDKASIRETMSFLRESADSGAAVILITHDLQNAVKIANKIAVFYAGTTVEISPVTDFSGAGERLRHPYSQALWRALPQTRFEPFPGFQPPPHELPEGCLFQPRCQISTKDCGVQAPSFQEIRHGLVRCYHAA